MPKGCSTRGRRIKMDRFMKIRKWGVLAFMTLNPTAGALGPLDDQDACVAVVDHDHKNYLLAKALCDEHNALVDEIGHRLPLTT